MPISTPPQNYALQPTGTSGTGVGPDLLIVNDDLKVCTTGDKGNIFIRGPPCFAGYETTNPATNDESFFNVPGHGSGWFNTGDMGSLDSQGYLFISGRSKEIINRGGETISPFEIEEAIQQHPHVKETLAFSAPHASYQESVGVIIVTKSNMTRVDLPTLHKYLEDKLHRSKWPQLIVYSDALPKNATGKTLRIRYAERIKLGDVDEESSPSLRLYEAACPPLGTALTVSIPLQSVKVDLSITKQFLQKFDGMQAVEVVRVDLASQHDAIIALIVTKEDTKQVIEAISQQSKAHLHSYLTPSYVYAVPSIPTKKEGKHVVVDYQALQQLALDQFQQQNIIAPRNAIEQQLELIWRSSLGCATMISINTSFFDLGGDSLKAGQVVASIRSQLRIPLSVADLLTAQTIEALAVKISKEKVLGSPKISSRPSPSQSSYQRNLGGKNSKLEAIAEEGEDAEQHRLQREFMTWDFSPPLSNNSFTCLFVQALPIALIYPLRRIVIWFLIAGPWVSLMKAGHGRFTSLLIAMFLARLLLGFGAPLVGIACKWLIIGKYKAGKYPLWGTMYLKWWLVEQIINIMGKGFFRDDLPIIGPHLVRWYYYLMGAQMGNNVQIHKDAKIGQADLLNIGDNVAIDNCTIRPFAIEEGHFVLLPITIGSNSSVGLKSVVAGGSTLPPDSHIGPLSSSHEVETDSDPIFRKYCRPTYQSPPALYIICFGLPVLLLVLVISFIPWFFVLRMMVSHAKEQGWYQSDIHSIYHAFLWWITPQRLMFFFLLRVVKRCIVPILRLAAIILIKWTIIGEFKEMQEEEKLQPWNRFRYWLMAKLLPGGSLGGVSKLVGTHYEMVSIIYRLLGAKVGKRVYWPGSGLEIVEYDLFEVGDDVVFGSRSVVITSSTKASKRIVLEAGTMVADRCVILPGVTLGKGAVLGSGALAYEDMTIEVGSVWLGSQHGSALNVAPKDLSYASKNTTTPFGKAFYEGKANYFVLPLWMIILYNTTWQAFCTW